MWHSMVDRRNIALNLDDEYLVLSACAISANDVFCILVFLKSATNVFERSE